MLTQTATPIRYGLFLFTETETFDGGNSQSMVITASPIVLHTHGKTADPLQTEITPHITLTSWFDGRFLFTPGFDTPGLNVDDLWSVGLQKSGEGILGTEGTRLDCILKTEAHLRSTHTEHVPATIRYHVLSLVYDKHPTATSTMNLTLENLHPVLVDLDIKFPIPLLVNSFDTRIF